MLSGEAKDFFLEGPGNLKFTHINNYLKSRNLNTGAFGFYAWQSQLLLTKNLDIIDGLGHIQIAQLIDQVTKAYDIERIKIEELWWNVGLPDTPGYEFKSYEYYETHLKVNNHNSLNDFNSEVSFISKHLDNVSISINADQEGYFFVSSRYKNAGRHTIMTKLSEQKLFLKRVYGNILETEKEFISFDSNIYEDEDWCPIIDMKWAKV